MTGDRPDSPELDLTPRTPETVRPRSRRGPAWVWGIGVLAVLGLVGAFLLAQLDSATLYYRNADEAVAQKESLGTKHFRIQGTYLESRKELDDGRVAFDIAFDGVKVAVVHNGAEPALFKPGIPVVLEGRWSDDGSVFLSDRIEVKHTEQYREANPDRLDTDAP